MGKWFRLSIIVVLLAVLFGIQVNAENEQGEDYGWSSAYKDFVIGKVFLTASYPYEYAEGELWVGSPWDQMDNYWVRLHDFDMEGIPELLISNGNASHLDGKSFIYTFTEGEIKYIGNTLPYPDYIPGSAYTGVFAEWHTGYDDHTINYYWKDGDKIRGLAVYQYDLTDPEPPYWITDNLALYHESQKQREGLYGATPEEIETMGWENFVRNALGEEWVNVNEEIADMGNGEETVEGKEDLLPGSLFADSSLGYNRDLALIAAGLSDAAEDKDGSKIKGMYSTLGFAENNVFVDNYGGSLAYSIADKTIEVNGAKTYLLVITARGSQTGEEFWKDFSTSATKDFLGCTAYDVVYDFEEEIWNGLEEYLSGHEYLYDGDLKVLITGHSLGGAAANLIAARFTRFVNGGAWWSDVLDKEDIYAYTFGAIDSIRVNSTVQKSFENIHNIYNFRDTFGPTEYGAFLPSGVGSVYGKFGHMDIFSYQYRESGIWERLEFNTVNHNMPSYRKAVEDDLVQCRQGGIRCIISCPVDVSVIHDGEVVGMIKDNEVVQEAAGILMEVIGESKYILFEETDGFHVLLTATADGEMSYSVEDLSGMEAVIFENISLTEGKHISTEIEDSLDEIRMYVVGSNGKIKKEIAIDGSERRVSSTVPWIIIGAACVLAAVVLGTVSSLRFAIGRRKRR